MAVLNKKQLQTVDTSRPNGTGSSIDSGIILYGKFDLPQTLVVEACSTGADIDITTGNAPATIDGEALATGKEYLLKDQADATKNGVYKLVAGNTLVRTDMFETLAPENKIVGVKVIKGTANADKMFIITNDDPVIDTDNISFVDVQSTISTDASYLSREFVSGSALASKKMFGLDVSNQMQLAQATTSLANITGMTIGTSTGSGENVLSATEGTIDGVTDYNGDPLVKDKVYCLSTTAGEIAQHDDAQFTSGIYKQVVGKAISTTALELIKTGIYEVVI
ncbi:hypothetical protein [Francisella marina]|uniref:Head decoration protein n=1 Tax=Francisella marina TaxID=2249302 RepID=A0ABX5ZHJ7_9GAMM|nr:hypothetical protein [Francisella marina]QEO57543.1 hypothetical protein F0R74_06645 [Francisella marina]